MQVFPCQTHGSQARQARRTEANAESALPANGETGGVPIIIVLGTPASVTGTDEPLQLMKMLWHKCQPYALLYRIPLPKCRKTCTPNQPEQREQNLLQKQQLNRVHATGMELLVCHPRVSPEQKKS